MCLIRWVKRGLACAMVLAQFLCAFPHPSTTTAWAQDALAFARLVRVLETHDLGVHTVTGLAFSPTANAFLVLEDIDRGEALSEFF